MTIWKYEVKVADYFELEMPKGTQILTIRTQRGVPCIWALVVNPKNKKEIRKFVVVGTGHEFFYDSAKYIGTFLVFDDNFIGHLFELLKGSNEEKKKRG